MNKLFFAGILLTCNMAFGQNEGNKFANTFVEKNYEDVGKISDFKAFIVTASNLSINETAKYLLLESKSFSSSDVKNIELFKSDVSAVVKQMNDLKNDYFILVKDNNSEISFSNSNGLEIGAIFVHDKVATSTSTKKEKFYVETKEKYYEGKLVNHDGGGSFIWKEAGASQKEITGKWNPFVRLKNNSSSNTYNLSLQEFDNFILFLEEKGKSL